MVSLQRVSALSKAVTLAVAQGKIKTRHSGTIPLTLSNNGQPPMKAGQVPGAAIAQGTRAGESKEELPKEQEQPKESVSYTKRQQFGIGAWQQADPIIQQRLTDIQSRVKLKWKLGKNACYACRMNAGAIVSLGESFPSGALIAPCHDGCECEVEEIFLEEGSQHSFFVKASDNGGNQSQNNSNANKN